MSRKREKFVQLAEKRVIRSIRDLRLIGNLANRNNYEYTEDDVKRIVAVLMSEIRGVKTRFKNGTNRQKVDFKLETPSDG
jgi:FKBP-type peptidyl-prolyl cis-trans isomerase (trigger factor)